MVPADMVKLAVLVDGGTETEEGIISNELLSPK
jgi:hypothetical protein